MHLSFPVLIVGLLTPALAQCPSWCVSSPHLGQAEYCVGEGCSICDMYCQGCGQTAEPTSEPTAAPATATTVCGANTNLNAGVCEIASTACGANTNLNAGVCVIASTALTQLCLTDTAAPTAALTATPSGPPNGLHLADPNAKLMFGPGPNAPCTIELNAGKLVSSCHIDGACSGRRLLEVHDEHNAEVASLKAENKEYEAKNEALKAKHAAKVASLEAELEAALMTK